MRRPATALALLLAVAALTIAGPARGGLPKCTCTKGNGCYHFLNAPVAAPGDPCSCPRCRAQEGACERKLPKGWNHACAINSRLTCFLRRHAASWKIACSERLAGECECKTEHPEWCPSCGSKGQDWGREGLERVKRQIEIERRIFGPRRKLVILTSPHFYLVSDVRSLKVKTQHGTPRILGMHEIAHVYIQRAEIAYQEFMETFGPAGEVHLPRPSGIYLVEKERLKQDIATEYFGLPEPELYYGGNIDRIGGGFPYNGCAISVQKYDEDEWLHFQMRHLVGHLLASCWIKITGADEFLPRWMYSGMGHWLSRRMKKFREMANFCAGEGREVRHSGRKWQQKILAYAANPRSHHIQKIFDVDSLGGLDLETHIRAWSLFDVYLSEDRERFVAFLAALREGTDHRVAVQKTMGMTPEEFDQRWRDRVLGRRPTVAPTAAELDALNPETVGAQARESIRSETDVAILSSKIRSLIAVDDPLTAATIVPLLQFDSEAVRESIVMVLSKSKSEEVKEWLRTTGLSAHSGIARAYVARVLGNLKDEAAADALIAHAKDAFWLTRAHVARALGLIGHEPSMMRLAGMCSDRVHKVKIAALDALGRLGSKAKPVWDVVAKELGTGAWQVRSAAAGCLGELGEWEAVEPLIARMEIESGRIRKDVRDALKKIVRDDLGRNPKHWRDWWEEEKVRRAARKGEPAPTKPKPEGGDDYGTPTYYGIRVFSRGLGYVLDCSNSMNYKIQIKPGWLKKHRRTYAAEGRKYDLARWEIEASLASLDPRTRFNIYFFRTTVSAWKNDLLPANPSNVKAASSRMGAEAPNPPRRSMPGEDVASTAAQHRTNYVDVLRLVLGVGRGAMSANLADTPDTMLFLTDGRPTAGDITDPETLLQWFEERNQFSRVKVSVITFGHLVADMKFLRRLAEDNGGNFVEVPSVN